MIVEDHLEIHGEDADGFHLITCKTGGGPHDSMMSVWSECFEFTSLTTQM